MSVCSGLMSGCLRNCRPDTPVYAEVAIEKGCTIIGVNLNASKNIVERTCPPVIRDIGAIFVSFSPYIIKYAIENYKMHNSGNYHYNESVYKKLGYKA